MYGFPFIIFSFYVGNPLQKVNSWKLTNSKKTKILRRYPIQNIWNSSCWRRRLPLRVSQVNIMPCKDSLITPRIVRSKFLLRILDIRRCISLTGMVMGHLSPWSSGTRSKMCAVTGTYNMLDNGSTYCSYECGAALVMLSFGSHWCVCDLEYGDAFG